MPTIKSHKNAVIITRNAEIVQFHQHRNRWVESMFECSDERGIFKVLKESSWKMNLWKSNFIKWLKWCRFIDFRIVLPEQQPFENGAHSNLYLCYRIYWQCFLWLVELLKVNGFEFVCCCNFSETPFTMQTWLYLNTERANTRNSRCCVNKYITTKGTKKSER